MKKSIFTLIVTLFFASLASAQDSTNVETGKIYFLRSTGFQGSAVAFKTFIDGEFVCKLNNKKYSIHEVPAGKHECSVQFGGKVSKDKAEKFVIQVEPGKITYVQLVFETGILINNIYCEEVTENTAKSKMTNMTEDTKCL
ncbi:DUF2846 domain-containing protein [Flavobacterium sinopsychrotolerans]|jgi:hypothetical protein|uniref:DUF2846 domain-containing protein n=1 Tax=Flavobacterium sinopsychrotolerans TaxID=604089 RepID=A0A1H8M725_9FLAO|nr:DUF2846 domain-containing protein [Flavobacterium sinopsychrotolerans]SEO13187.1 Protein of unknown function [Flavobacterium sinopsychrotolerans]